ncbi:MAG: FIST N-terminal domain-containing protein [Candidatus Saelkia tenebricola]|nr:FIST N-terminal domain-containing protein [Candidatus Saelkia tenebricola]
MALRIGTGLSSETNAYFAGKNASLKALESLGVDVPELGIAFSHYEYPILQINDGIKTSIGERNLVVINSEGNILNETSKKRSLLLTLLSGHSYYHAASLVKNISSNPYISGHHLAWELLDILGGKTGGKESLRKLAIVFASNSFYQKSELLRGLQEVLGIRFPITGGIISTDSSLNPGALTFNREGSADSVVGILLAGENLVIGVGCYHGWIPLGLPKKVKKIDKNRLQDLDDMTPLKYYMKYLGKHLDLTKEDIASISTIHPLGIEIEKGKEDYLLRFPRSFEPGGSILFDSQMLENQHVRLLMGTRKELLAASKKALREALKPFEAEQTIPNLIIITSAIERKEILGIDINNEISYIRSRVPDTTKIIGLYTHGQFSPYGGSSSLTPSLYHNGAITITAVGMKKA